MRNRAGATDVLLTATVLIWALNLTVTKYVLSHGFAPLAYSSIRYALAAALFAGITVTVERSLAVHGRHALRLIALASLLLWVNQISFVYSLKLTTATTTAIVLGTIPVFTALFSYLAGVERVSTRFWVAALVSFGGVALVALGSGGELSADLGGVLLGLVTAVTWSAYSVTIAPLMRRYSPYRISAILLLAVWIGLFALGSKQVADEDFGSFGGLVWGGLVYSVLGPLVLTNVLWFTAIRRVGPARATLFTNLQPFAAAVFALLLLSEAITSLQIAGGVAIACGILLARGRPTLAAPVE